MTPIWKYDSRIGGSENFTSPKSAVVTSLSQTPNSTTGLGNFTENKDNVCM